MQIYSGDCFTKYSFLDSSTDIDEKIDKEAIKICAHTNWIRSLHLIKTEYLTNKDENINMLASVSEDCFIKIWNLEQNSCLSKFKLPFEAYAISSFESNDTDSKSNALILGGEAGSLVIYDFINQTFIKKFPKIRGNILSIATTYDKKMKQTKYILNSNSKGEFYVWDWRKDAYIFKKCLGIQPIHYLMTYDLNKDVLYEKIIVAHTYENSVLVWDIKSKKRLKTIAHHTDWVKTIKIDQFENQSKKIRVLFSAGSDQTIRLTNLSTGICFHVIHSHTSAVLNLQIINQHLVSCESNGKIIFTNLKTLKSTNLSTGLTLDYYQSFQILRCPEDELKILVSGSQPRRAGYHFIHIYKGQIFLDNIIFGCSS